MLNNLQLRTVLLEMKSSILETLLGGTWRRFRVSSECLSILMLMDFGASSTPPLISNQMSLVSFGFLHRVPSLLTWGGHLNQCRVVAGFPLSFIDIRSPLCPITRFPTGMYSSGLSICEIYDIISWEFASPIGCPQQCKGCQSLRGGGVREVKGGTLGRIGVGKHNYFQSHMPWCFL